jgi:hypothetical protein
MPEITTKDYDAFSKKLESFSASLSDTERTLFKHMFLVDRDKVSEGALDQVTGGGAFVARPISVERFAPRLDANFFQVLCW